jgi:hypothetical protein
MYSHPGLLVTTPNKGGNSGMYLREVVAAIGFTDVQSPWLVGDNTKQGRQIAV